MDKKQMKPYLQTGVQASFLACFIILLWIGLVQLWIVIFGISVIGSIVFGRFYCGWVCPINLWDRSIGGLYEELGWERVETPSLLRSGWSKWIALIAFLGSMIYLLITGIQFPVVLIVTLIGFGFFLVFEGEVFHKYICPYGTILSLSSKYAPFGLTIDSSKCTGCGQCQDVCPNNTITTLDSKARKIEQQECLTCLSCVGVCPVDAIEYRKISGTE